MCRYDLFVDGAYEYTYVSRDNERNISFRRIITATNKIILIRNKCCYFLEISKNRITMNVTM